MQLEQARDMIRNDYFSQSPGVWADLGCGSGLFTRALGELLPYGSIIYAIDKNISHLPASSLSDNTIKPIQADFANDNLVLQDLDGILMANSLHYVEDKDSFIRKAKRWLKPDGSFLIVEYDTDTPMPPWVPYPLGFRTLQQLFTATNHTFIRKLADQPSRYGRADLYAAIIRYKPLP